MRGARAWFAGRRSVSGCAGDGARLVNSRWTRRSVTGPRWAVRGKQLSYFIGEPPSPPTLTALQVSRHCETFDHRSQGHLDASDFRAEYLTNGFTCNIAEYLDSSSGFI